MDALACSAGIAQPLLTHVAIDFGCAVAGPVMLGAGRYLGLGLCRRLVGTAG